MRRLLLALLISAPAQAQWAPQSSNTTAELRGLSVVSDRVAWASGTRGTVVRTTDGGITWRADTVPGAAALDFRDIHAESATLAWAMSAGSGSASRIYHTRDGGRTWTLQWQAADSAAFLDAISFWDESRGIAFGDPVGAAFFLLETTDGGRTWSRIPTDRFPAPLQGEAAFAASGSSLVVRPGGRAWIGTGGAARARVLMTEDYGRTWEIFDTPMVAGSASAGIYSVAFADDRRGVAVGGDYTKAFGGGDNVVVTEDGGRTWTVPVGAHPAGYRSQVALVPGTSGRSMLAVGLSGTDRSDDGGRSWVVTDTVAYNSAAFASRTVGWAVGPRGRIARFDPARAIVRPALHPDASQCFDLRTLSTADARLAAGILRDAADSEALYTLLGAIKPFSSDVQSLAVRVEPTPDSTRLAQLDRMRRVAVHLRCGPLGFLVQTFAQPQLRGDTIVQQATVGVYHRGAIAAAIARHQPFFATIGLTPSAEPLAVVSAVERAPRADRWRGYGYLFGYPDAAVDFFVRAGIVGDSTGRLVPRDFRRIETYRKFPERAGGPPTMSSFVYAVPRGAPESDEERALRLAAAGVYREYLRWRARYEHDLDALWRDPEFRSRLLGASDARRP